MSLRLNDDGKTNSVQNARTPTFRDDYLFVGDSRGTISIYTATSGNFAKVSVYRLYSILIFFFVSIQAINTHEADILTISTNGESVFCAGIDYRIQVMKLQLTHNVCWARFCSKNHNNNKKDA